MGSFQNLILTKQQFDFLKTKKYEGLVFQFHYPKGNISEPPKLVAYAMKKGHKKISDDAFQMLEYDTNSKPVTINNEQYIGSLQITKEVLEKLFKDSNPSDPDKYIYLLFSPEYAANSKYVIYNISVEPTTATQLLVKPAPANPSPPATAFS